MSDILELQASGEPPTRGDALDWVAAIHMVLSDAQQVRLREAVRTTHARRTNAAQERKEEK